MGPDDFTLSLNKIQKKEESFPPLFHPVAPIGMMELTWYSRTIVFHAHRTQQQGNNKSSGSISVIMDPSSWHELSSSSVP